MKINGFLASCVLACLFLVNTSYAKTVIVGLEPQLEPFEYYDKQTKELTGFDVELIEAILSIQGYNIEYVTMTFDALIPSLITHDIDVAISTITITKDRRKRVDFSMPYYHSGLSILINSADKDKIKNIKDLEGQSICTQIGTTGSYYAQEIRNVTLIENIHYIESINQLKAKKCIAAINDKPVNDYYLTKHADTNLETIKHTLTSESYAIAVLKGNSKLLNEINMGMEKLKQNGKYQQIYNKYFRGNQ